MLITTRRFTKDGKELASHKARDTDPLVRKGAVVEAEVVGEIVRDIQNEYFIEKGLDIRVDPIGIVPQEHLGPVRMRNHMNDALIRAELIKSANEKLTKDPEAILSEVTREKAVFKVQDIERFCNKHIPHEFRETLLKEVLTSKSVIELFHPETSQGTNSFTLKEIREQEKKLLRFSQNIADKQSFEIKSEAVEASLKATSITKEQADVFEHTISNDSNLKIIQGRAGVGKSYVLSPIREAYENSGFKVIGLAPTNKVVNDLKDGGFTHATTCHSLLFQLKNKRTSIDSKTVLVVDEAAMLGTELMVELFNVAKRAHTKVILVGDERQLPSIERGGMFEVLAQRFESRLIETVQRQQLHWQRQVSEDLSNLKVHSAVQTLKEHNKLNWHKKKQDALSAIVNQWSRDSTAHPKDQRFILAQRNIDVDALNAAVRDIRKDRGELGEKDYIIETTRGSERFSCGDRVLFTLTDKEIGVFNGNVGIITGLTSKTCLIKQDNGQEITLDPRTYRGLKHGYAGTIYKAQGATIDQVYVLHDRATNHNNSYVALTRHSKDIQIFINRDETRDFNQFINQISRTGSKTASVNYLTLQEVQEKQKDSSLGLTQVARDKSQAIWTHVKDYFHQNEDFYKFEDTRDNSLKPVQEKDNYFVMEAKSCQNMQEILERRLHSVYQERFKETPDQNERTLLNKQSYRTLYHLKALKSRTGQDPSHEDVKILSARARLEIKRSDEIKKDVLNDLKYEGPHKQEDILRGTIYGDRLASIEGREFEKSLRGSVASVE